MRAAFWSQRDRRPAKAVAGDRGEDNHGEDPLSACARLGFAVHAGDDNMNLDVRFQVAGREIGDACRMLRVHVSTCVFVYLST